MSEILSDHDQEIEQTEEEKPINALVVFGFGIRSDRDLENMAMDNPEIPRSERLRLPLGAKLRTVAAAELYYDGQVGDVIFTGGPVKKGEGVEESEAELMEKYFLHILANRKRGEILKAIRKSGVNPDQQSEETESQINQYLEQAREHVTREDRASNTIENFSNTVNFLRDKREQYAIVGLESNKFHLDRIVKLAGMHQTEGTPVSAEQTVLEKHPEYQKIVDHYFSTEGNERFREEVLNEFGSEEENEQVQNKYFGYGEYARQGKAQAEARLGTSYKDYLKGEKRWSRGLDEIPEYWMQGLQFINNDEHLLSILRAEQGVQEVLRARLQIEDIDQASMEDIRKALSETERVMPPAEWGEQGEQLKEAGLAIFSDIDGTFLEPGVSPDVVKAAMAEMGTRGIVVLNSSRTADNMLRLQEEYDLRGPIVAENGGEICIPTNFININKVKEIIGDKYPVYEKDGFIFVQIGENINGVIEKFEQIRHLFPGKTELTGEMSVETIMRVFAVDEEEALKRQEDQKPSREKAKYVIGMATDVDPDPEQIQIIREEARKLGINITRAKYLWHIMGDGFDKGLAVRVATEIFRSENPNLVTVGVGDADNDIEMLEQCDRSYLVGDLKRQFPPHVIRTSSDGPSGWKEMVETELKLLKE